MRVGNCYIIQECTNFSNFHRSVCYGCDINNQPAIVKLIQQGLAEAKFKGPVFPDNWCAFINEKVKDLFRVDYRRFA